MKGLSQHQAAQRSEADRVLSPTIDRGAQADHAHAGGDERQIRRVRSTVVTPGTSWRKIAAYAEASGQEVTDLVSLVLTDIEMPEMDGYILTKKIKSDPRFAGVPVIMHSSLSGCPISSSANRSVSMSMCQNSRRRNCPKRSRGACWDRFRRRSANPEAGG